MPDIAGSLKPPRQPSPPISAALGQMYFDTTINKLLWWSGSNWIDSGGQGHIIQDEGTDVSFPRTKLNFVGAGVTAVDDGENDATIITIPGGGGGSAEVYVGTTAPSPRGTNTLWVDTDETQYAASAARVTTLPVTGLSEGLEVYWAIPAATNQSATVWHMRYNATTAKWECVGGPPIQYLMLGENANPVNFANGTNVTVNAAQTKLLNWAWTPPCDCWAEVEVQLGIVQKTDAAYHYAQFSVTCSPAPALSISGINGAKVQHSGVNYYDTGFTKSKLGLTGGVAYNIYCVCATNGGTWVYFQNQNYLQMFGKAWPR